MVLLLGKIILNDDSTYKDPTFFYNVISLIFLYQPCQTGRWIPNPGVPGSKPLGGSKVDSAFHPSEVDKMSVRNSWELWVKSKLSPRTGFAARP